jgi:hypothetical protein
VLVIDDVFRPLDALPRLQAQRDHGSLRLPLRLLDRDPRCSFLLHLTKRTEKCDP